ncbi:MAG: LptA/OstA family protein [Clostridia bacterium]
MDGHARVAKAGAWVMRTALLVMFAALALPAPATWAAGEKVVVTADKRVAIDFDADVTVFEGSVRIAYSDVVITADRAEVRERKTATITGNVKLVQPDIVLTGDVLTAYISEKRVVVEGGVTLTKDEKKSGNAGKDGAGAASGGASGAGGAGDSSGKERVVVTCDRMELKTSTRGFVASGHVEMKRGNTLARAERATYTEKDRLAILEGNVFAEGKNKETVKCGKLLFRTDRDHVEALDNVTLEFEVEEEGEGKDKGAEEAVR